MAKSKQSDGTALAKERFRVRVSGIVDGLYDVEATSAAEAEQQVRDSLVQQLHATAYEVKQQCQPTLKT